MDKKYLKSEILNLLEAITEQSEIICSYENNIPIIELDIIKVNIRSLYESVVQLEKINNKKEIEHSEIPKQNITSEATKIIIKEEEKQSDYISQAEALPKSEDTPKIEDKPMLEEITIPEEPTNIEEQTKTEETSQAEVVNKETTIVEKVETKPIVKEQPKLSEKPIDKKTESTQKKSIDLFSDGPTMSDKFKNEKQSLNERIAQTKNDVSVAVKINKTPLNDIKLAIGINEKFRFVNELFDGNLSDYTQAINQLNTAENLNDAFQQLDILSKKHKWDLESKTYLTLKELVDRRHFNA